MVAALTQFQFLVDCHNDIMPQLGILGGSLEKVFNGRWWIRDKVIKPSVAVINEGKDIHFQCGLSVWTLIGGTMGEGTKLFSPSSNEQDGHTWSIGGTLSRAIEGFGHSMGCIVITDPQFSLDMIVGFLHCFTLNHSNLNW